MRNDYVYSNDSINTNDFFYLYIKYNDKMKECQNRTNEKFYIERHIYGTIDRFHAL